MVIDELGVEGDAGFGERALVALVFFVVAGLGLRVEEADALVAEADEMLHGAVGAAAVVDAHHIDTDIGAADEEDDREVAAERLEMIELVVHRGVDEEAVDAARAEHLDNPLLFVERMVRGRKQRAVAARGERELDLLGGLGEGRVPDVGEDETDGLGLAAHQRAGDVVGLVVELGRGAADDVAGFGGDARTFAQGERHRVGGKAGLVGDVLEAGCR